MLNRWRIVVTTAAVMITTAGLGSAQTVYVRNAPADSNVEVVLNAAAAGTGVVDATGEAKVAFKLPENRTEMDANVFVDTCDTGKLRKVILADRSRLPAPPAEGCERREVPGIYWVRPVNTIVVDVAGAAPSLLLVRGSYTPPAPTVEGTTTEDESPVRPVPTGLLMFGGGAFTSFRDAGLLACGNAPCDPKTSGFTYTFGVDVWLTRFIGVEGAYLHPKQVKAGGGDGSYIFTHTLDSDVWTIAGKAGAQAGIVRVYGKGGINYHQATSRTAETIGTQGQVLEFQTKGWSWVFGGGLETWLGQSQRVAIFGDAGIMRIKGADDNSEARIDDRLKYVTFGVKVRLSR